MPKKKSSRPSSSLGTNHNSEPKSESTLRRERVVRIAAIVIVLALVLSVLAGAFSVTPAQAVQSEGLGKSVQNYAADDSPLGTTIDTDGDGIINNEDPDIDGDGIVNATDGDIDGDGTSNFDDGDPAATNGFDGNAPQKPGSISFQDLTESGGIFWILGGVILTGLASWRIWAKTAKNRGKNARKNI
jgi:hypothetical protein